jgi:hypothetical protein
VAWIEARTTKSGKVRYRVYWCDPSRKIHGKVFARKRDAEAHGRLMEQWRAEGTYFDPARGKIILSAFVEGEVLVAPTSDAHRDLAVVLEAAGQADTARAELELALRAVRGEGQYAFSGPGEVDDGATRGPIRCRCEPEQKPVGALDETAERLLDVHVVLEEEVEVDQVVHGEDGSGRPVSVCFRLGPIVSEQARMAAPVLGVYSRRDEKREDLAVGTLLDLVHARWTGERVRALVITSTRVQQDGRGADVHLPTPRACRSDDRHATPIDH